MNWKAVVRDTIIVCGLTLLGGIVVGFAFGVLGATDSPRMQLAIALSNLLFIFIGFVIAGCLTRDNRFRHLSVVAVCVWLTSIINVFVWGAPLGQWLLSIVLLFILAGIGGSLSFLFVQLTKVFSVQAAQPSLEPDPHAHLAHYQAVLSSGKKEGKYEMSDKKEGNWIFWVLGILYVTGLFQVIADPRYSTKQMVAALLVPPYTVWVGGEAYVRMITDAKVEKVD